MWLTDAHFLEGDLQPYMSSLLHRLPDSRIVQFPTTRVHTQAKCDTHNRMGAAMAIVSYRWKGFLTHTYTDPMGLGIVNALYFKVEDLTFSSINAYFLPSTHGDGPATLYARISRFLDLPTTSPRLRHLPPEQVVYNLVQKRLTKARFTHQLVFLHGDFNTSIPTAPKSSHLSQWMATNDLHSPSHTAFSTDTTYYTRSGQLSYRCSTIDHMMHLPLPPDIWVQSIGTVRNTETETVSDHLPIWIRYAISRYTPRVPLRKQISSPKRLDILRSHAPTVTRYNERLTAIIDQIPQAHTIDPEQCGAIVASICRASVETVQAMSPTLPIPDPRHNAPTGKRKRKYKAGFCVTRMHIYTV